ncbi:DH domain-containing protein [Fusarium keratoplasticum]|uniref:DH domain-containing protein n=1 Tax=Fusarium keratoplasticum TaxID=1328300 RepID=A0ACC0QDH0_9HYPO|nr:DH domain-containing protein [Fusarium keratoplasticum]KAI8650923.1 DH domain-containing protein [Fusarium keratoplasticum]
MADPLSIAASIAGLLSTTGQIAKFLGPYVSAAKETPQITAHVYSEVQSTQVILAGLQNLTQNLGAVQARHASLIAVHQVVTILTDGVLLFSELEAVVRSLPPREGSDQRLPLRARLLWARKESTFTPLLTRVQSFKSSMSLILMILQSDSDRMATQHQEQLSVNINALLERNHSLSRRLMNLEDALDVQTIVSKRMSLLSVSGTGPQSSSSVETQSNLTDASTQPTSQGSDLDLSKFDFEDDLESSRVYRRAQRDTMDFSFRSSVAPSNIWSIFSGLSLGDISIISVVALPVYQEDITNAENYDFGAGVEVPTAMPQAKKTERGLLYECFEIKLKMLQIPEMNEYFEQDLSSAIAFYELWVVFSKGMPLLKLVQALDPQIDIVVDPRMRSPGGRGAAQDAIFQFLEYCRSDLKLSVENLFTISDLMGADAYGFSKVITVVSFIIERLTVGGVLSAVDTQLEELVPTRLNGYPAEEELRLLLEEFLADQYALVRQLQELVEVQTSIEVEGTLFRNDMIEIFGNTRQLTSMHIGLLVRMEQNLFLPFSEQRWTEVFQFYLDYISEESEFVANEQKARAKIRSCIGQENNVARNSLSIQLTRCLRILPLPAQRFPKYSAFLKDLSRIASMSISQGPDLKLARANLRQAISIINDRVRSEETSEAFTELKHRVEDWRGHNPTQFGTLLLYDSVIITKDKVRRPYRAYLFRNILLICKELELQRKQKSFQFWKSSRRLQSDKQTKFQLKGRIFLNNIDSVLTYQRPGSYKCDVWWFAANEKEKQCFSFEFAAEAQMILWSSKLDEARARFDAAYGTERDTNSHLLIEGVGPPIGDDEDDEADKYYFPGSN